MKLLSVHSARAIWLLPTNFLNPRGLYTIPLLSFLKERYSFARVITPDGQNVAEKFEDGVFTGAQGVPVFVSATIHNDGIVVDTRSSTQDADLFLEDALTHAHKEFGLANYAELPIKKLYVSEVYIKLDAPFEFDKKWTLFAEALSSAVSGKKFGPLKPTALNFGSDPNHSERVATFRFEREINAPFEENRFYSLATTQTVTHLHLLEMLEKLLLN